MERWSLAERVAAISTLDEPIRRELFDHVSRSDAAVSRDAATEALGLAGSTAAFHLDRLADEGLLAVESKRLTGRGGPGSGRSSKLYTRAAWEVAITIPERCNDFAAQLVLTAVEESTRTGEPAGKTLLRIAGEAGRALGCDAGSLEKVLEDHGFEPRAYGDGTIVLRNCPFHRPARVHTDTVGHLNLQLLRGGCGGLERPVTPWCSTPGSDGAVSEPCHGCHDMRPRSPHERARLGPAKPPGPRRPPDRKETSDDQAATAVRRARPKPVARQSHPRLPA